MQKKPDIVEIMRRSRNGEYCSVKDWDVRRIPKLVRTMLKKYGIAKTVDPENPVNTDMELADAFYKAGALLGYGDSETHVSWRKLEGTCSKQCRQFHRRD